MFENLVFKGQVRHRRFQPKYHEFSYKLFMFCFNIGLISSSFKNIKQISIEKFNLFSYRRKNYLSHPEIPLDQYARQLVMNKFHTYPQGKIYLITNLSCLGYCFNPVSLYFIFDANNQNLDYLILDVTNTPWGEKHSYVLKSIKKLPNNIYNYKFKKKFHVSPFMEMNCEYILKLKLDKHDIIVHMENHINDSKNFDATLTLKAENKQKNYFNKTLKYNYLMTYKVAVSIYWQALKLWFKGVPVYTHPKKIRK